MVTTWCFLLSHVSDIFTMEVMTTPSLWKLHVSTMPCIILWHVVYRTQLSISVNNIEALVFAMFYRFIVPTSCRHLFFIHFVAATPQGVLAELRGLICEHQNVCKFSWIWGIFIHFVLLWSVFSFRLRLLCFCSPLCSPHWHFPVV